MAPGVEPKTNTVNTNILQYWSLQSPLTREFYFFFHASQVASQMIYEPTHPFRFQHFTFHFMSYHASDYLGYANTTPLKPNLLPLRQQNPANITLVLTIRTHILPIQILIFRSGGTTRIFA